MADSDVVKKLNKLEIDQYSVVQVLGKHQTGRVCLAHDSNRNKKVVLKGIPESQFANSRVASYYHHKIQSLLNIENENVAKVYEAGCTTQSVFTVTEYVEGMSLARIAETSTLCSRDASLLLRQALRGVLALHDKGIIHGDLCSENIIVDGSGILKVVNLGILPYSMKEQSGLFSQPVVEQSNPTISQTGIRSYSPAKPISKSYLGYCAPEVLEGESQSPRTDLWSLGAVFYEIVTGEKFVPIRDMDSQLDILQRMQSRKTLFDEDFKAWVHPEFAGILKKMLTSDDSVAYSTAQQALLDIEDYIDNDFVSHKFTASHMAHTVTNGEEIENILAQRDFDERSKKRIRSLACQLQFERSFQNQSNSSLIKEAVFVSPVTLEDAIKEFNKYSELNYLQWKRFEQSGKGDNNFLSADTTARFQIAYGGYAERVRFISRVCVMAFLGLMTLPSNFLSIDPDADKVEKVSIISHKNFPNNVFFRNLRDPKQLVLNEYIEEEKYFFDLFKKQKSYEIEILNKYSLKGKVLEMNEALDKGKYIGRVFDDRGVVVQNIDFEVRDIIPPELLYPAQDQVVDFFAFEEMEFRWNQSEAAKRYQVQLSLNENFGTLLMDVTVEGNTLKFPPLSGGTYYWRVRPETGEEIRSLWSETSIFHLQREQRNRLSLVKVEPQKQLAPDFEILVASKTIAIPKEARKRGKPTKMTLAWSRHPDALFYRVQVSRDIAFRKILLNQNTSGSNYEVNIRRSGTYFYRVALVDRKGAVISPFSKPGVIRLVNNRGRGAQARNFDK